METKNDYLSILHYNDGFHPVEEWLDFARTHHFKKVKSIKLSHCPDCHNENHVTFGQYVYYSNIFHIKCCPNCGLYFSDKLLNSETVAQHFESAYKDERYFSKQRKYIFEHIVSLADRYTPENGKVLDIGGAKGDLINKIKEKRRDIYATLNDLSETSCKFCSEAYGIKSICCNIPDLVKLKQKFNTILLIDVIYYEPRLNEMFEVISKLLDSDKGVAIIRVPNKLMQVKFYQTLFNMFGSSYEREFQCKVRFFNPEHIYIFSQSYLSKKLKKSGFNNIVFLPSPMLNKSCSDSNIVEKIFFRFANIVSKLTFGKLILTPSMIVVGSK